jgi:hypothetical protein
MTHFQGHDWPHCIAGGTPFPHMLQPTNMLPDPTFAQRRLLASGGPRRTSRPSTGPDRCAAQVAGGTAQPWDAILGFNGSA